MMNTLCRYSLGALAAVTFGLSPVTAAAALVTFGDLSDPGGTVVFEGVQEENELPDPETLYVPTGDSPEAVGDNLLLDPTNFRLDIDGPGSDILDSELGFTIVAKDGYKITSFRVNEAGNVQFAGGLIGGIAGATVNATILVTSAVVDGEFVDLNGEFVPFVATDGGIFELPGPSSIAWEGSAYYDALSELDGKVTELSIVIDNTLSAEADELSSALIDKKEFSINVETMEHNPDIPEPTALGLLSIGVVAGVSRVRRRGRQRSA